jgi:HEAT repeat protein
LRDEDAAVRAHAAEALGEIGDPRAVKHLIAALRDEAKFVRAEVVDALGQLAQDSDKAVEALVAAATDANRAADVRQNAVHALIFCPKRWRTVVVLALTGLLRDQDQIVRILAAEYLGLFGPDAKRAIPALVTLLSDPEPLLRAVSAEALGRTSVGPEAANAAPALVKLLADEDESVRAKAAAALGKISIEGEISLNRSGQIAEVVVVRDVPRSGESYQPGKAARIAAPALAKALLDSSPRVRDAARLALCLMGRDAATAVPELERLSRHKDAAVRQAAIEALKKIKTGRGQ